MKIHISKIKRSRKLIRTYLNIVHTCLNDTVNYGAVGDCHVDTALSKCVKQRNGKLRTFLF